MVSIFSKARICRAIRRFIFNFFANQNFSQHRKAELLCKWIALVLQAKFCFMGCLVKANALVLGNSVVVIITVNSISFYETAISREIFFRQYFCELLEKFSSASKYVSKSFRKFTKTHPW